MTTPAMGIRSVRPGVDDPWQDLTRPTRPPGQVTVDLVERIYVCALNGRTKRRQRLR
jgi:hypothetical protein